MYNQNIPPILLKLWDKEELSFAEQAELDQWVKLSPSNAELLRNCQDEEYVFKKVAEMMAFDESYDKEAAWKQLQAQIWPGQRG